MKAEASRNLLRVSLAVPMWFQTIVFFSTHISYQLKSTKVHTVFHTVLQRGLLNEIDGKNYLKESESVNLPLFFLLMMMKSVGNGVKQNGKTYCCIRSQSGIKESESINV